MSNKFTLSDIIENPLLGIALNNEYYKQALEDILANANTVDSDKPEPIICFLLMKACEYCGVSIGYRTIYYDLASSVISVYPNLWTAEEKEDGFALANNHWELYPGYQNEFEEYDTCFLEKDDFFTMALEIYEELTAQEKSYFAFAFLTNFLKYDTNLDQDRIDDFRNNLNLNDED